MLRSKRNYKVDSKNVVSYSKPQTVSNQERFSCTTHCREEQQIIVSNIYKENWNCNTKVEHYVHRNQNMMSTVLRETSLINSIERCIETKSTIKKKKHSQKVPKESVSIQPTRILRSASNTNQIFKKCEKDMSNRLMEKSKNDKKSNNTKIQTVIEVNHEEMLKRNLPTATHAYNKCKNNNLCNNIFSYDKMLKEHHSKTHFESHVVSQQTSLSEFQIKRYHEKSLRVHTRQSTGQSILQTNIQSLNNLKCENPRVSKKDVYKKGKRRKYKKSYDHVQVRRKRQQKIYHTVHEYKQHNKIQGSKYPKRKLRETNTINYSEITMIESSSEDHMEDHMEASKAIVKNEASINTKKIVVPLTRIEDMPWFELSKLVHPNICQKITKQIQHTRNSLGKQGNEDMYYETQYSAYKQCTSTGFTQNEKINESYKSVFETRCTNFRENVIEEIDTNIKNNKFEDYERMLKVTHLQQNILQFFLKNRIVTTRNTRYSEKRQEYGIRKCIAMCNNCKKVLNLLQQFSDKINFLQDEKLRIECTLCDLQINSLSQFQQHVMNVHLKCKGKSLNWKTRFEVDIVTFNEKLNSSNNDDIFECCCCSNVFHHVDDFEDHVKRRHCMFNYTPTNTKIVNKKQEVKTSELYTASKNEQICNKNCILNNNLTVGNITEIGNQKQETNIQNDINISQKLKNCTDTKGVNFKNSVCYNNLNKNNVLLAVEAQGKQMDNTNHSSVSQMTEMIPKILENMENLNVNETYSNNSVSVAISNSELPNISSNKNNGRVKGQKKNSSFTCNICFKVYKRQKKSFLTHLSKHITNSEVKTHKVQKQQKIQEIMNGSNIIESKHNLNVSSNKNNRSVKGQKKFSSFTCNICFKMYKKHKYFLTHLSNHGTNSEVKANEVQKQQKIQEIINDSNIIESKHNLNVSSNKNNGRVKGQKKNSSFTCNICFKVYKRQKKSFLTHLSKHITNSGVKTNKVQKQQKIQEIINDSNIIESKHNPTVSNAVNKNSQDSATSCKDNNISNSTVNLKESTQDTSRLQVICKEGNNIENDNIEHVPKQDNGSINGDKDCNYTLHINLKQKFKEGMDNKKSLKRNVHVAKKCKTDTDESDSMTDETTNKFPNTNVIQGMNEKNVLYNLKELYCSICDTKCTSEITLKEHMLSLHDYPIEDVELPNLSIVPYFNDYNKINNQSTQNTDVRKEQNISPRVEKSRKPVNKKNNSHKNIVNQSFHQNDTNKQGRKWRCSPCRENFALLRNYLRHKYYCHNDESVIHICDNCNKVLTSVAMVNIHTCTSVTSWNCKRCNLKFPSGIALTQHNTIHHMETVGPHICEICKSSFLTTYMLQRHEAAMHPRNDENDEFSEKDKKLLNNKTFSHTNRNIECSKVLDEINEKFSEMNIAFDISYNNKEVFKCEHCHVLCTTELQMKVHVEEWHKVELCQICNYLYLANELTKHVIHYHMVPDNLFFNEDDNDIITILGWKRLLSLYEYQRFDNVENKCFDCICSDQFLDILTYKIHYLRSHDMICLLCNIEFKHSFQAFEHKIKIHKSISLYLWVVQKLILATLQLNRYGNTIEEVILKYSETRI